MTIRTATITHCKKQGKIGRFIYLKQLLDNRLPLKYMNGESADEYKKALGAASKDNIKLLTQYIENQKDFIAQNKNMTYRCHV